MTSVGIPVDMLNIVRHGRTCSIHECTNMVDGNKSCFVLENHHLVLRVSVILVSPIVYSYFGCLGAIFWWNVEYAASWYELVETLATLSDTSGVVDIWVRRH